MKLKTAIIGYGGMAQHHRRRFKQSGKFKLVAAFDTNPESLEKAKKHGLKAFTTLHDLLSEEGLQCVLIATPNDVHEQYAVECARAGIHVLCEKPVTLSSQSLANMIKASEENKTVFMVHQNRRWDRDFLMIKKLHDNATMGAMYKVESTVCSSHGLPGEWRSIKARGGGMLWDWGVHLVDQILTMHPGKVRSVFCKGSFVFGYDCDDGVFLTMEFEDGFRADIKLDTNSYIQAPRWTAFGLDGTAIVKDWSCRGHVVKVKTFKDDRNRGLVAGNGFTKTMNKRSFSTKSFSFLPWVKVDTMEFHNNFYDCIAHGAEPVIPNDSVMRCMKVLEAGFASMEQNQVIKTDI